MLDITYPLREQRLKPTERKCGDCSLCCKLVPVSEIGKPANQRCMHQRVSKGCVVYRGPRFPRSCALWSCGWLMNLDAADLPRPDHAHYVIDPSPDYITVQAADGTNSRLPVVQIWIDPRYPHVHRSPSLRTWLARRAETLGHAALIRRNSSDGFVLLPPAVTGDGWIERDAQSERRQHSMAQIFETCAAKK